MARYRFMLTDVITGAVLSDAVTLRIEQYGRKLNGPSDLSATLDLGSRAIRTLTDPIAATEPRRTALHVIRDEAPVWSGIIWTRRYRSESNDLDLSASTWESYFARRRIRRDYGFVQWDQNHMIANMVLTAQTEPANGIGDVRIDVPQPPDSGVLRDRTLWWHERATYLERMQQLAGVMGGPDFTIAPYWRADGQPGAVLLVGTPLGANVPTLREFPGDLRNYSWPDDGGDSANYWSAIGGKPEGAGDDVPPVIRDAQMSAEWDAGIPLLEDASSHSDATDPATLSAWAQSELAASAGNRVVPEATVQLGTELLSSWSLPGLGDIERLRITDPYRFPANPATGAPGLVTDARVTGWTVHVGEGGETLSLTLGAVA